MMRSRARENRRRGQEGHVLKGKVALVTGAARGLGFEAAKALAIYGATVLLNGRSQGPLDKAVEQIEELGGKAHPAPFDVTDETAVACGIADAVSARGRLDILVNNVGARDRRSLFDFALEDVRQLLAANLIAPFHLAREAARAMIERGECGALSISLRLPDRSQGQMTRHTRRRRQGLKG